MSDNAGRAAIARGFLLRVVRRQPGAMTNDAWRTCRAAGWFMVMLTNVLLWANYDSFTRWCAKVERNVHEGLTARIGSSSSLMGVKSFPLNHKE